MTALNKNFLNISISKINACRLCYYLYFSFLFFLLICYDPLWLLPFLPRSWYIKRVGGYKNSSRNKFVGNCSRVSEFNYQFTAGIFVFLWFRWKKWGKNAHTGHYFPLTSNLSWGHWKIYHCAGRYVLRIFLFFCVQNNLHEKQKIDAKPPVAWFG